MSESQSLLITHARPHFDDVVAIWLLKKFHPDFKETPIAFTDDKPPIIPEGAIAIGIGRGQFDEHKGDAGECAASLVWKWLKEQPGVSHSSIEKTALDRIVGWALKEDLGELNNAPWREMSVVVPVENYWTVTSGDNLAVYDLAAKILEAIFVYQQGLAELDLVWPDKKAFASLWGPAIALETAAGGVSQRAYQEGNVLIVQIDPTTGARQFRADATSEVDLTAVYEVVHTQEPQASWFLHHGKKLLLCGSRTAPKFVPSQFTLEQMIELVRPN